MSHLEDTAGGKLCELRETSQNAVSDAAVDLEAKGVERKRAGRSAAKFIHAKCWWCKRVMVYSAHTSRVAALCPDTWGCS